MEDAERKSIPYAWCVDNGVELHGKKLKVNWKWDVERLLAEIGGMKVTVALEKYPTGWWYVVRDLFKDIVELKPVTAKEN